MLEKINTYPIYTLPNKMAAASDNGNSFLLFRSAALNYSYQNSEEFKKILAENFSGCGWKIPGILQAMTHSKNVYFDEVCQIKMQSWTKGRVALIGDAAYCPGFPTGMGASLAMQGAEILAAELMKSDGDYNSAFSKYNERFHPVAEAIQETILNGLDFLAPMTLEAIRLRNERLQ